MVKDTKLDEWGVFLARLQPLHNGHIEFIRQGIKECKNLLIIIGSSNKKDNIRNPFDINKRHDWLVKSLAENKMFEQCNIKILHLPDFSTEKDQSSAKEWGNFLYYNIIGNIECKNFSFYYGDDPTIVKEWFTEEITKRIKFRFMDRLNMTNGLCATKIRESLLLYDRDFFRSNCPLSVYEDFDMMRSAWIKVINNPAEDKPLK